MADNLWYYAKAGQQHGPVNLTTLQNLARSGELRPADLVWTDGMGDWLPAGGFTEIFPLTAPAGQAGAGFPPPGGFAPPPPAGPIPVGYYNQLHHRRGVEYAGFWLRFCAAFIDGIILGIGGFIVGMGVGVLIVIGFQGDDLAIQIVSQTVGIVMSWLYAAFMESSQMQATLGKMAIGIKVTDVAGNRITFGRATGRFFAKYLSMLTLLIGYIMAGFTEKKQALHDMLAGTLVVRK